MKVYFILNSEERGADKIDNVLHEFSKDPDNTLVVTDNPKLLAARAKEQYGYTGEWRNSFIVNPVVNFIGKQFKKIIFNRTFFNGDYEHIWYLIVSMTSANDSEVYIFDYFRSPVEDYTFVKDVVDGNENVKLIALDPDYKPKTLSIHMKVDNKEVELFKESLPQVCIDEVIKAYKNVGI